MRNGYILVGAATPTIKVADCDHNSMEIIKLIDLAVDQEVKILVFPELSITGASCDDLFFQGSLIQGAIKGLEKIIDHSKKYDLISIIGLPYLTKGNLYNTAAVIKGGEILALIPKSHINSGIGSYQARYFTPGEGLRDKVKILGQEVDFTSEIIIYQDGPTSPAIGVEFSEESTLPTSMAAKHCFNGANLIVNLSSRPEVAGGRRDLKTLIKSQSKRLKMGYIYAEAGNGESTTDNVYSGYNLIFENGRLLKEGKAFENKMIISEMDFEILNKDRAKNQTYKRKKIEDYIYKAFEFEQNKKEVFRQEKRLAFIPEHPGELYDRCEEIIDIQVMGLCKRLSHINCQAAVIGASGGLDSTLALLITSKAFKRLGIDSQGIKSIVMPCFGSTNRTHNNALSLAEKLGTEVREIPIHKAVELHFKDIGHDINVHNITYENAQARERTQVLMDIANMENGIVIGTGSMSEMALGWATYNGDHMSMYGVNLSVAKTMVAYLVAHMASEHEEEIKKILEDVLKTPISPELLPLKDGKLDQKTEDVLGPYEVHDFFLYYILRYGFRPRKIYGLACKAFQGKHTGEEILKWLNIFYTRFISQQFKRSCIPNGPKVGNISLSPRGELVLASDASVNLWLKELKEI